MDKKLKCIIVLLLSLSLMVSLTTATIGESKDGSITVGVEEDEGFVVTIDAYDGSMVEGEIQTVEYTVENHGADDTQDINFTIYDEPDLGGDEIHTEQNSDVTLGENQSKSDEFTWESQEGDVGEYSFEVSTEDDDSAGNFQVTEEPEPYFSVSIIETNSPVEEGDTLKVNVEVENTGDTDDTQMIELYDEDWDNTVQDSKEETLSEGEDVTITLEWNTDEGDAQSGDIRVVSEDDEDLLGITIEEEDDDEDDDTDPVSPPTDDTTTTTDGDEFGTEWIVIGLIIILVIGGALAVTQSEGIKGRGGGNNRK